MSFIEFFITIIVPIAAVIGAALSIFNTYQNWKNTKPNIKIEFDIKVIYENPYMTAEGRIQEIKEIYEIISVTNKGLKTVTLSKGYLQNYVNFWQLFLERLHLKQYKAISEVEFFNSDNGIEVQSWKNYEIQIDHNYDIDPVFRSPDLPNQKEKLIAIIVDQAGHKFKSKPFYC